MSQTVLRAKQLVLDRRLGTKFAHSVPLVSFPMEMEDALVVLMLQIASLVNQHVLDHQLVILVVHNVTKDIILTQPRMSALDVQVVE